MFAIISLICAYFISNYTCLCNLEVLILKLIPQKRHIKGIKGIIRLF